MEKKWIIVSLVILGVVVIFLSTGLMDKLTGRAIIDRRMVAYYSFERNVVDMTGGGNDGQTQFTNFKYGLGRQGLGLDLDGEKDFVLIGDKDDLEAQKFTLSFWAKLDNPLERKQGGVGKGYVFGQGREFSYKIDFELGKANAGVTVIDNDIFKTSAPVDEKWHLWTMSVGDGKLKFYKDGLVVGASDYTGKIDYAKTDNNFVVGARANGVYPFYGKIDEVKFWNYALSAKEIMQDYNSYNLKYCGDNICSENENFNLCAEDCLNCLDSDKGIDYSEKGFCKDASGVIVTDKCETEGNFKGWLKESYCTDKEKGEPKCVSQYFGCAYGCQDGVCLPSA